VHKGLDYGRSHNPTRWALERCVADLESGGAAFAFASGLAAIATVLELLDSGAHVIAGDDLYGGTYRLLEGIRKRSAGALLQLSSISPIRQRCPPRSVPKVACCWWKRRPIRCCAWWTCRHWPPSPTSTACSRWPTTRSASPWIQRPLELGFDIVVHSSTKYLNGHSDVIGGIAVVSGDERNAGHLERLQFLHNAVGAIAGPFDSYLTLRGVKTLNVRMQRHCENAQELAAWLERAARNPAGQLSRSRLAPAACAGAAADAWLRRHDCRRAGD
jgi:cystathionine gamma-lyase